MVLSIASPVIAESVYTENTQQVLATAYYSPLPNQSHYYLGSYENDIRFNGQGIYGNDGTPVYPGMIAAPASMPFGTVIELPGYGIVGTVHDRGGRITDNGIPRIDIWMGKGEEGLARALEWGARTVDANVFLPQPEHIPQENLSFSAFEAPPSALSNVPSNPITLVDIENPRYGDTSAEVAAIQFALKKLGYFDHDITDYFGDVTKEALSKFQEDVSIRGNGEIADEKTRRTLIAHHKLFDELGEPVPGEDVLLQGTSGKPVRVLQRVLSLLGLYTGEIDGIYDQELMSVIYRFQQQRTIVRSPSDAGSGMVGTETRRALLAKWREHRIVRRGGVEVLVAGL
jgi:peptidoglycan hydrolase-like protein with peptidoglycan-binding domain/3D (Asp-Asp-Asp) domain-containing protein